MILQVGLYIPDLINMRFKRSNFFFFGALEKAYSAFFFNCILKLFILEQDIPVPVSPFAMKTTS